MWKTLLILVALESVATAAPTAQSLYLEGQKAYDHGDYSEALAAWEASYQLSGMSPLLFNIAQAQRRAGDCAGAVATYRKFIAIDPTSDQGVLAAGLARELEPTCGTEIIRREHKDDGRALRIVSIATGGAGVAMLAIGLGLGHHAAGLASGVTNACAVSCDWGAQKLNDQAGRRDAAIGYALDGVGIAAIAAGALMYKFSGRHVIVAPKENGAVVSMGGAW